MAILSTMTVLSMMLLGAAAYGSTHRGDGTAYSDPYDMNATGEFECCKHASSLSIELLFGAAKVLVLWSFHCQALFDSAAD